MRTLCSIGTVLLLGVAGCQKPETPEQVQTRMGRESAAARTQIEALAKNWERWQAAGHADSIAGEFAEQGQELPPHAPSLVGRAAIQASEGQQMGMGQTAVTISVDEVSANGPLAVARGGFVFTLTPGPGAPAGMAAVADTGKWMGQLQQTGGTWQFTNLIWNSNLPLPQPAAAAAPARPSRRIAPR